MAFYELRQYEIRPGKMDEWLKLMEEEIIPFQIEQGKKAWFEFSGYILYHARTEPRGASRQFLQQFEVRLPGPNKK